MINRGLHALKVGSSVGRDQESVSDSLTKLVHCGFVFQAMQYLELLNCFVLDVLMAGSRLRMRMRSGFSDIHEH